MSLLPSRCSDELRDVALRLGASRLGIAAVHDVDEAEMKRYRDWIAAGCHGEMQYLDRYHDARVNPAGLLAGARSVIVCAFNYYPPALQRGDAPQFAYYSYGKDYHEVVRGRLSALAAYIHETYGGDTRVCVDTAPLPERYWAVEAGLGFKGLNSQLIIPGLGSYFFLGEIITTVEFAPDERIESDCGSCGACVRSCPGKAIRNGEIDARRCLSYLTIEYRGEALPMVRGWGIISTAATCVSRCVLITVDVNLRKYPNSCLPMSFSRLTGRHSIRLPPKSLMRFSDILP